MGKDQNSPVFLKSIHIQGFKSFADKVKFELGQGLCVIVGPNGSGKSNIADAIRWVVGEQSAKSLRGAKMEDVIFAGSAERSPIGMAEVSLIFDNATGIFPLEYEEISITRRVYRDGEGEYYLNRVPCRLKDIHELFMDTGAGKEGFSIIGQGRVEEMLSAKAEDRRQLIEEAAGITKYRVRKKETVKKMEDTDRNLQRLADILTELETQLEPLALQAETASRWLELNREQRQLEIQAVVQELTVVDQRLTSLRSQAETFESDWAQGVSLLSGEETNCAQIKQRLLLLEEKIQLKKEQVHQAEQDCADHLHQITLREERIRYRQEEIARLQNETAEIESKQGAAATRIQTWKERYALIRQTLAEEKNELETREKEMLAVQAERDDPEEQERLKAGVFNALAEQTDASNALTGWRHRLDSLDNQRELNEKERAEKELAVRRLSDALQQENARLGDLETQRLELENERQRGQTRLLALEQQEQKTAASLAASQRRLEEVKAKRKALQALNDSLEGYQRGVREVIQAKRKGAAELNGLCGTAAELIRVKQIYELAIETAVGGGLQNIVAQDESAAKKAIRYLKQHQLGRATFLPLDVIRAERFRYPAELEKVAGFIGLAVDLVDFDEKYRPAMEYLFGRILVVEGMDTATAVAQRTGYRVRVVTLEGDQVNIGGSLTGGSSQQHRGHLLGRTREIEELAAEMKRLQAEELQQSEQLEALSKQKREKIVRKQENEMADVRIREQEAQAKAAIAQYEGQRKRGQEEAVFQQLKQQELQENEQELRLNIEKAIETLRQREGGAAAAREALEKKELAVKAASVVFDELSEKLTRYKVSVAKLEQEQTQTSMMLEQENLQGQELGREIAEKKEALRSGQQALAADMTEAESWRNRRLSKEAEKSGHLLELDQHRSQKNEWETELTEADLRLNEFRRAVQETEQKKHQHELNLVRLEADWDNGLIRLAEEFGLQWTETEPFRSSLARAALTEKAARIKNEIEALGPVNQAAIEEYPKLAERYEFLCEQRQDLLDAREKLQSLIGELDQQMCERFAAGFAAVNEAFQSVFRELFNGGQAELRLLHPEDLLSTGVEIIAQPPGKKLQWLSLLSGGEKALTAIALIFALLRVKPSPFCILDEIEASLDDANVRRFATYLQQLSGATQFIVISHRKGTMAEADVLYGVSMEQSGTSRLLTVSMEGGSQERLLL
ncbi:MAG: chromosome segregation protein SMC [Peptococcaceae bacterium]|jgi:chromosome segregation protein|nr:chromosome segregation protein SMC [Peptococcaceae bacterium]